MRKVLFASGVIAVTLVATLSAQIPAAFDPLAIGGKDTEWFMSRVGLIWRLNPVPARVKAERLRP